MTDTIYLPGIIYTLEEKIPYQADPIEFIVTEEGCHECTSHAEDGEGYRRISRNGKQTRVHRYVYMLISERTLAENIVVRHKCDNPACMRYSHLEEGTIADNVHDRDQRGRTAIGSKHGKARLNEHLVYKIRFESDGFEAKELSLRFNVSQDTIRDVRNWITWKHVTKDYFASVAA